MPWVSGITLAALHIFAQDLCIICADPKFELGRCELGWLVQGVLRPELRALIKKAHRRTHHHGHGPARVSV